MDAVSRMRHMTYGTGEENRSFHPPFPTEAHSSAWNGLINAVDAGAPLVEECDDERPLKPIGVKGEPPKKKRRLYETPESTKTLVASIQLLPVEKLMPILVSLLTPMPDDFPSFSKPIVEIWERTPRPSEEDDPMMGSSTRPHPGAKSSSGSSRLPYARVSDLLNTFVTLVTSRKLRPILMSSFFRRKLWRSWLDHGVGRSDGIAVPDGLDNPAFDYIEDQTVTPVTDAHDFERVKQEITAWIIASAHTVLQKGSVVADYVTRGRRVQHTIRQLGEVHWFTQGFVGSVVLHRVLLNSARNAHYMTAILARVKEYIGSQPMWVQRPPQWIDGFVRGDIDNRQTILREVVVGQEPEKMENPKYGKPAMSQKPSEEWAKTAHSIPQKRWPNGWFAPMMCGGSLHLDFRTPTLHHLSIGGSDHPSPEPEKTPSSYSKQALAFLELIRESSLRPNPPPWMIRLPAVVLGRVMAPAYGIANWTRASDGGIILGTSITYVAVDDSNRIRPSQIFFVSGPAVAANPARSPPMGLGFPDDYAEESGPSSFATETNEETYRTDDFTKKWFDGMSHIMISDVRMDSPHAFLRWLHRVGSRSALVSAFRPTRNHRGFRLPLGGLSQGSFTYLTTYINYDSTRSKLVHLNRCWAAPLKSVLYDGFEVDPRLYDMGRETWTLDVGPGTTWVEILILTRCPRLTVPTQLPDIRASVFVFSVPIYWIQKEVPPPATGTSDSQYEEWVKDDALIRSHGRIDRLLTIPGVHCALIGATFTKSALDNVRLWFPTVRTGERTGAVVWDLSMSGHADTISPVRSTEADPTIPILGDLDPTHLVHVLKGVDIVGRPARLDRDTAGRLLTLAKAKHATAFARVPGGYPPPGPILIRVVDFQDIRLEGPTLIDFLRALSQARMIRGDAVWLTLSEEEVAKESARKAAQQPSALGSSVHDWAMVQYEPFDPKRSRQLSVRMSVSSLPQTLLKRMATPRGLGRGSGVLEHRLDVAGNNPDRRRTTYMDFSENAIRSADLDIMREVAENLMDGILHIILAKNPLAADISAMMRLIRWKYRDQVNEPIPAMIQHVISGAVPEDPKIRDAMVGLKREIVSRKGSRWYTAFNVAVMTLQHPEENDLRQNVVSIVPPPDGRPWADRVVRFQKGRRGYVTRTDGDSAAPLTDDLTTRAELWVPNPYGENWALVTEQHT